MAIIKNCKYNAVTHMSEFNHEPCATQHLEATACVVDPQFVISELERDALRGKVLAVHDRTLAILASADTIEELETAMAQRNGGSCEPWTPAPGPNPKGGEYSIDQLNRSDLPL